MLPVLGWVILAILVFNVAFVAFRLWVSRERPVYVADRRRALPPAYATILAKEYPHRSRRADPRTTSHH